MAELAKKYDLHLNMITNWKRQAIENPRDEIFREAAELLRKIKSIGLDRLQFETEEGVVYLHLKKECPLEDEF